MSGVAGKPSQGGPWDVIVSGAGPAGLTLAIDLGQRGIRTLLLERNAAPGPWPKMERTNARSMEIYRRLGLAETIRAVGYDADTSMDVFTAVDLATPIARLRYPTVGEERARIAATRDGSAPLEPYQLVSQYALEPVLKATAEALPRVDVRFGEETVGFAQDADGVEVETRDADGRVRRHRARFLVGCDGGSSFVRKSLGIRLEGQGRLKHMSQVQFRSETLYARIPIGKGRHYYLADGAIVVVQGNRTDFSLHTDLPADTDFVPVIRRYIPGDYDLEVLRVNEWDLHLLVAERYRDRRVFLAGDAVHLVIPTGGLGMNTAVGDVADLAWKLAATVQGWGGPMLLDSYEFERRRVGLFNRDASGWAAQGPVRWRAAATPAVFLPGAEGEAARAALAPLAQAEQRRVHDMVGAELGYHYAGSPIVASEPGAPPPWDRVRYVPSAQPGARLPHAWLPDGRAVFDLHGTGYTLLALTGAPHADALRAAFARIGAPLEVIAVEAPELVEVYGAPLLLLRPDLHVVWRGARLSDAPPDLADIATGHACDRRSEAGGGAALHESGAVPA
ncbi:FAD-dependent monooxygenase [Luteimonas sp. BDR2-5]|uniref:FAD-dependent monooxygenase n=1 Tax=Proluteimonas luteida TaxID=2878685 RepID=UPI001E369054|nr:FAD-dependent monooxygenase [Luteimonas sp. BDR2-5]MCD9027977.1 FAD-dependent monooxygenase [Luteimonas sp. BDR2-5]